MAFIDTITMHPLPEDQYVNKTFSKSMIFIHHTASGADPYSVLDYWVSRPERVATAFIIAGAPGKSTRWKDGEIVQCFNSAKGAWHLGLTAAHLKKGQPGAQTSTFLNMNSVGIEVTNWGRLILKNGKYLNYNGDAIPEDQVHIYDEPFRGSKYYHKYTPAQITSLRNLLLYLCDKYSVDKEYKGNAIWDVDKRALRGENGIWTHVSVRPPEDKQDMHPYPPLVDMLKSL